jgi:diguanylate cyclase (GGDEF)-like protein
MLDIDHFKEINDTHGHDIGDQVLQALVIEAHRTIRDSDTFARWGGEEFIILLPETNMHNASTMAERLRRQLSKTELNVTNATSIRFTVSIGLRVVSVTDADIGVREIINDADRAMYHAKLDGRNTVSLSE